MTALQIIKSIEMLKKVIGIGLVLGICIATYGFYMYNKPPESIAKSKTELSVSASQLVHDFKINEAKANEKYMNKIVEVNGKVQDISEEDGISNITLSSEDPLATIVCEMEADIESVSIGDQLTIKGQCVGYLMDVVVKKCIIL